MAPPSHPKPQPSTNERVYPENPVVVRVRRGDAVESQHRGAWVLCDAEGRVLEAGGAPDQPVYARSTIKCLQALPLVESGAAERFDFRDDELALALASHNAETCHTEVVARVLARLGAADLRCGPQAPGDPETRAGQRARGEAPSAIDNNCSGKHAGFLALALHLGVPKERYLDPDGAGQRLVREAVLEVCGLRPDQMTTAVDGCSAPTFRMPLAALATGFARVATPYRLHPARGHAFERMLAAVAEHPVLIAGSRRRVCTDLVRATGGRLFPKIGGEAVYAVGLRGGDRALAIKIDDGGPRGLHALLFELLERFRFATADELAPLAATYADRALRNWAGLEVGRIEVVG